MSARPGKNAGRNADPDHRQAEAAVRQWWDEHTDRPAMTAVWWPGDGLPAFLKAFDPKGELGDLGGVFTPLANGNLVVHWAGQTHTLEPGWSWTYRPRRDRTIETPAAVIDPGE